MSKDKLFDRTTIIAALRALGVELQEAGISAQIFIVGGAAMALAYSDRRITKDIDAIFAPKMDVYAAAKKVAARMGLPDDWLNDAVKGYVPGEDSLAVALPEVEGIEVSTASPRFLLAMKLMAMRIGEDDDDIKILLSQTGINTMDEANELMRQTYPRQSPPAKTRFFLEEFLSKSEPEQDNISSI